MLFPLGIDFQNRGFESCLVDSDPGIHALVDGFQHSTIRHSYSSAQETHRTNRSGNKQHPSNKTTEQQNNNSNNEGKGGLNLKKRDGGGYLAVPTRITIPHIIPPIVPLRRLSSLRLHPPSLKCTPNAPRPVITETNPQRASPMTPRAQCAASPNPSKKTSRSVCGGR